MSRTNPRYHRTNPLGTPVGSGTGVIRYKIIGSIENQMTVCDFDFYAANPSPTQTQLTTILGHASTALFGPFRALVSSDWTCQYERIDVVHSPAFNGVISTANVGVAGQRGAGHLPTEVALPFIKITGLKGQHGRGRVSIPAICTADTTNSVISAAALITNANAFTSAYAAASLSDGTNNWQACVSTRQTTPPKVVQWYSPVTNMTYRTLLGTIRRRKIGRGK